MKQTNHLRTNSTRKNYLSESSDDFDETFEDTKTSTMIDDDNNSIIKPSHSLDDLLDIDDNQNEENIDDTENDDDDDNDSIQLNTDQPNTTKTKRQKKSNKKKGKL